MVNKKNFFKKCSLSICLSLLGSSPFILTFEAKADDTPLQIMEPTNGMTSEGSLHIQAKISKGVYEQVLSSDKADATMSVEVENCATRFEYLLSNSGKVSPIALNPKDKVVSGYNWDLDIDLTKCQCQKVFTNVHHCDGCGNSFVTFGQADTNFCKVKTFKVRVNATNKASNLMCTSDLDGDGKPECEVVSGLLAAKGPVYDEDYVPAGWWEQSASGEKVCIKRANSGVKNVAACPSDNSSSSSNSGSNSGSGSSVGEGKKK